MPLPRSSAHTNALTLSSLSALQELLNVYDTLSPAPSVSGSRNARLGVSPFAFSRRHPRRDAAGRPGAPGAAADAPESSSALHADREGFFISPRDLKPTTVLLKQPSGTVVAKGFRGAARLWRDAVSLAQRRARAQLPHPRVQGWAAASVDSLGLGPGLELYFRNLTLWTALFLVLSFVVALSLAVNLIIQQRSSAFNNEADMFAQTSLGVHVGVPNTRGLYYGYGKNDVILALSLADILHVVLFAAACLIGKASLSSRLARRRRQLRQCGLDAYSVQVSLPSLPANAALADEVKAHFEELYGAGSVAEVVLATDSAAALVPLFRRRAEARDWRRHFSALVNLSRSTRGARQRERAAAEAEGRARAVLAAIAGEPPQAASVAFVTFESAAVREKCVREHTAGLRGFGLAMPQELLFRRWFRISVRPAPDPATVRWEHLGSPAPRRLLAVLLGLFGALALVCATWAIADMAALRATDLPPATLRSANERAGTLLCDAVWDLRSTDNNVSPIRKEVHWMMTRADSQCAEAPPRPSPFSLFLRPRGCLRTASSLVLTSPPLGLTRASSPLPPRRRGSVCNTRYVSQGLFLGWKDQNDVPWPMTCAHLASFIFPSALPPPSVTDLFPRLTPPLRNPPPPPQLQRHSGG